MKVKVIPDQDCCTVADVDEEGNALIEQSAYDNAKAMMKGWIDEFHGKNVAFQKGAIAFVFREDWTIQIIQGDHPMAKSEAAFAEYFIGECGFSENVLRY